MTYTDLHGRTALERVEYRPPHQDIADCWCRDCKPAPCELELEEVRALLLAAVAGAGLELELYAEPYAVPRSLLTGGPSVSLEHAGTRRTLLLALEPRATGGPWHLWTTEPGRGVCSSVTGARLEDLPDYLRHHLGLWSRRAPESLPRLELEELTR